MQIELKRLQRDTGITFVFVTHDQEEALTMSDRIAVMSQGKVRQIGGPRDIYDHPAERFVADFIGEANMLPGELIRSEGATGRVRLAPDFEVVAINIDTRDPEKPKTFLKEAGLTTLTYFHDQKAKVFQDLKSAGRALGMPTSVLVDGAGCEIGTIAGPAEWASEDAIKLIKAATTK